MASASVPNSTSTETKNVRNGGVYGGNFPCISAFSPSLIAGGTSMGSYVDRSWRLNS